MFVHISRANQLVPLFINSCAGSLHNHWSKCEILEVLLVCLNIFEWWSYSDVSNIKYNEGAYGWFLHIERLYTFCDDTFSSWIDNVTLADLNDMNMNRQSFHLDFQQRGATFISKHQEKATVKSLKNVVVLVKLTYKVRYLFFNGQRNRGFLDSVCLFWNVLMLILFRLVSVNTMCVLVIET